MKKFNCPNVAKNLFVLLIVSFVFAIYFESNVYALTSENINFQGKIVRNDTGHEGLNVIPGTPACVIDGSGNDTCDFQVAYYTASTGGTLLLTETFSNVEIGQYDGVFELSLGSGSMTTTAQCRDGTCNTPMEVISEYNDMYVELKFAPDGVNLTETFNRMPLEASPYSIFSKYAEGAHDAFKLSTSLSSTSQSNPETGMIYYNTTDSQFKGYNGSAWVPLQSLWTDAGTYTHLTSTTDDLLFGGSTIADSTFFFDMDGSSGSYFEIDDASNTNRLFTILSGGNVGIGTATPSAKLEVAGASSTITNASGDLTISTGGLNGNIIFSPNGTGSVRANSPFGIRETGSTPTYYTYFQGGDQVADVTYTLPTGDGTTSGQVLTTNASGVLSWQSVATGSTAWDDILDPDGNTVIVHGAYSTDMQFDTFTSGSAFKISSAATGLTGSLLDVSLTGSNAANTGSLFAINNTGTLNTNTSFLINHYATGIGNLAFRVNDESGDTTPFVIDGSGKVGIGISDPDVTLEIIAPTSLSYDSVLEVRNWMRLRQDSASGPKPMLEIYASGTWYSSLLFSSSQTDSLNNIRVRDDGEGIIFGSNSAGYVHKIATNSETISLKADRVNSGATWPRTIYSINTSDLSPTTRLFTINVPLKIQEVSGQSGDILNIVNTASNSLFYVNNTGNVGIGTATPSAVLNLKAGTSTAGTAPLKFTTGVNLGTAESGAMEWDGSRLYMTNTTPTRNTLAYLSDLSSFITQGYQTIQEEGSSLTQRSILNFVGSGFTAADDTTRTNITLNSKLNAYVDLVSANGVLTNTSGTLSWVDLNRGDELLPTGTEGQMLYNNAGTWTAYSGMYWDDVNSRLGIGTTTPGGVFEVSGGTTKLYDGDTIGSITLDIGDNLRLTRATDNTAQNIADYVFQAKGNSSFSDVFRLYYGGAVGYNMYIENFLHIRGPQGIIYESASAAYEWQLTYSGDDLVLKHDHVNSAPTWPSTYLTVKPSGNFGIGVTSPTAYLHLKAGTSTAGTAPLKFTTGVNLGTAESGAMEWDGSRLYMTNTTPTRNTLAYLSDIVADTDNYVDSLSFNTSDGILTLGRTGILADLTYDLDGRYALTGDIPTVYWSKDATGLYPTTSGDNVRPNGTATLGTSTYRWNFIYGGNADLTSSATTTNVVNIVANSLTSGSGLKVSSTATTGLTGNMVDLSGSLTTGSGSLLGIVADAINGTGSGLKVTSSTTGALTNGLVYVNGSAAHTGNLVNLVTATATGIGLNVTGNSISTGTVANLSSTSTAGTASGTSKVLNVSRSGANTNLAHTAYGIYSTVTNTNATSGTNIAGYFSASGATTANYGLIVAAGNTGIGTTAPTQLLDVNGTTRLRGQLYDYNNEVGTPGQVLSTTATGVDWITLAAGHNAVTLAGEDYLSIDANQVLTASDISLTTNVTGTLGIANGGTNATSFTSSQFLWYNGTSIVASGYDNSSFASSTHSHTVRWDELANPTLQKSFAMGSNITDFSFNSITTQVGFGLSSTSLTSGNIFKVSSSATGMTGSLANISLTGNNAANTGSVLSLDNGGTANTGTTFLINHYATGTNNLGMRVNDVSGDTTPFIIDGAGNVAIGKTSTTSKLLVNNDNTLYSTIELQYNGTSVVDIFSNVSSNIFIGLDSGSVISTGTGNVALGDNALSANTTGLSNTAIGHFALDRNVAKQGSTALGYQAMMYADSTATAALSYNTAIGYQALSGSGTPANNTGTGNTAVGHQSMTGNTSGSYNTGLGVNTLNANTSGTQNVAIGYNALYTNVAKQGSVAIGYGAMRYADSTATSSYTQNTAIGYQALYGSSTAANNTGGANVAVGSSALYNNTSGGFNVATGVLSLRNNTTGFNNVGVGYGSLFANTTGVYNVALGSGALGAADGSQNTAIGYMAGYNLTSGSGNIFIGDQVQPSSSSVSNQLNIGDAIYGDLSNGSIGIGDSTPDARLVVVGLGSSSATTNLSLVNSSAATLLKVLDDGKITLNSSASISTDGTNYMPVGGTTNTILLAAEYPGAVLTADGTANVGTMTADSEADTSNQMNYYEWSSTESSLNDYDVRVRFQLPSDFSGWGSGGVQFYYATESTSSSNNKADFYIYEQGQSSAAGSTTTKVSSTAGVWTSTTIAGSALTTGCNAASDICSFYIRMSSLSDNYVRVGDILITYDRKL